jgi:TP901 family phage tail tape measure protein
MPDLTSRLTVQLLDHVSGPAKKAGQGMKGLAGELQGVENKLQAMGKKKFDLFNFSTSRKQFNEAKAELRQLVVERQKAWQKIRNFEGKFFPKNNPISAPLRKWRAEYAAVDRKTETTIRKVKSLSSAFEAQKSAAIASAKAVNGLNYNHLLSEERKLRASVEWSNRVLGERTTGKGAGQPRMPGGNIPVVPRKGGSRPTTGNSLKDGVGVAVGWSIWQTLKDAALIGLDFQRESNKARSQGGVDKKTQTDLEYWSKDIAVRTGLNSPIEIMGATTDALKAGVPTPAVKPFVKNAMDLSAAGDVPLKDAVSGIVAVAAQFKMDVKTAESANATSQSLADDIALAADATRGSVSDIISGLKFAGSYASLQGLSPRETIALLAPMIQAGQSGDEAGVALRSLLVRGVKPTKDASQAMAELGLNMTDYATGRRDFTGTEATAGMENRFGPGPKGMKGRVDDKIAKLGDTDLGTIGDELTALFQDEYQAKTAKDKELIAGAVRKFVNSQATEFDVIGMISALQNKGVTTGQISRIFDSKQGGRLTADLRDKEFQRYLDMLNHQAPGTAGDKAALSQDNGVGIVSEGVNIAKGLAIEATTQVMKTPGRVSDAVTGAFGPIPQGNGFGPPPKSIDRMAGEKAMQQSAQDFEAWRNGPEVQVNTDAATRNIGDLETKLNSVSGMTVAPTVATGGLDAAIGKLQQIINLLGRVGSAASSVDSKVINGAHADVAGAGGRGW